MLAAARSISAQVASRLAFAALGDQHRELQRLLIVQSWIHLRAIGPLQIGVGQAAGPTGALGDILAGQFDVRTPEVRALLGMDAEGQVEFLENVLEAPGLGLPVLVSVLPCMGSQHHNTV